MLIVKQCEEKYLLTLVEVYKYKHKFSQLLHFDNYSKNGSYRVRSLYFDTANDKDFFVEINEQNIHRRIRLRIYDEDDEYAKFET